MNTGPSFPQKEKHLSRLVDPLGYPQEAPHLREGHGIQAAHGTETVQAQEVDACQRLDRRDGLLWLRCLQTLLHVCKPCHLPRGLRVMFCCSPNQGGSSCKLRKSGLWLRRHSHRTDVCPRLSSLLHRHHVQLQRRSPHQPPLVAEMLPSQCLSCQVLQPLHEGHVATVEAWAAKWLGQTNSGGKKLMRTNAYQLGHLDWEACIGFSSRSASKDLVVNFSEAAAARHTVLPAALPNSSTG